MGIPYLDNTFSGALEDFARRTGVSPGVTIRFDYSDTFGDKQVYCVEIQAMGKSARATMTEILPETIKEMCRNLRHTVGDIREIRLGDFDVVTNSGNCYINTMEG